MRNKWEYLSSSGKKFTASFESSWKQWMCLSVILLLVFAAIILPANSKEKNRSRPDANFSRFVVVGDSLSAGFQNGSLLDSQQVNGYANLIAKQAGGNLELPLIAPPGIPNVLELVSPGPPPIIITAPGTSAGRENPFVQTLDLAVPGATLHNALATRPGLPIDDFTDLILGLPGLLFPMRISRSQVEWAEAMHPTMMVAWIGNNDALGAVVANNTALLTPVPQFRAEFKELMDRLSATGAQIVVANIPDVTAVPFLTSAEKVAAEVGQPLAIIGPILGIAAGDFVMPGAAPLIFAILSNPSLGPLPDSLVLRAAQVVQIQTAVNAYNEIIGDEAEEHGAGLVDIHQLINRIQRKGVVVDGRKLTTDFLGGLFSLDGIHPTNTGHAIIANNFIHVLNDKFDADLEPVSVEEVAEKDPLVIPKVTDADSAIKHVEAKTVESLRTVMTHQKERCIR